MNTSLFVFPLLLASSLHAARSSSSCCPLRSFIRILDIFTAMQQSYTEESSDALPSNPCPTIDGHPGEPVCRTDGSIVGLLPAVVQANLHCPYLSPVSFSSTQDRFQCVAYTPPSTSFTCPNLVDTSLCRYQNVSDAVHLVGRTKECTTTGSNLSCRVLDQVATSNGCSPTIVASGVSYPLTVAYCYTGLPLSFPSHYAALLAQVQCVDGNRLIVRDRAGCYVIQNSTVKCSDGGFVRCYYYLARP